MIGLPFRILSTVFVALFLASKWVRRAVAAVLVSAVFVALQNPDMLQALAGPGGAHLPLLKALGGLAGH